MTLPPLAACGLTVSGVLTDPDASTLTLDRDAQPGSVDSAVVQGEDGGRVSDAAREGGEDAATPNAWTAGTTFSASNGATWRVVDGGIRFNTYATHNHVFLTPDPPLPITSDDYTVRATILMGTPTGEVGVITRAGEADAGGVIVF